MFLFSPFGAVANSRIGGRPIGRKIPPPTHAEVFPPDVAICGPGADPFRDDWGGTERAPLRGVAAGMSPGVSESFRFRDTSQLRTTLAVLLGGMA